MPGSGKNRHWMLYLQKGGRAFFCALGVWNGATKIAELAAESLLGHLSMSVMKSFTNKKYRGCGLRRFHGRSFCR